MGINISLDMGVNMHANMGEKWKNGKMDMIFFDKK
jgi:hypothetical protein